MNALSKTLGWSLCAMGLLMPLTMTSAQAATDSATETAASVARADSPVLGHWLGYVVEPDGQIIKVEMTLDHYHCFAWLPKSTGAKTEVGYYTEKDGRVTLLKKDKSVIARFQLQAKDQRVLDQVDTPKSKPVDQTDLKAVTAQGECCKLLKM